MCFSASSSFGLGLGLSAMGIACIKKVQITYHYFFASIPIIFAIQQLSEGFVWLSLSISVYAPLQNISTYIYLFFAQIVWPFWIPFSIYMIENKNSSKFLLQFFLTIGCIVSIYLAYCLLSYNVNAKILAHHIYYQQDYPDTFGKIGIMLYLAATILPPLFSSFKKVRILSGAILISYLVSLYFYKQYVVSVWCFFAAIISSLIFYMLNDLKLTMNINNE